MSLHYSPRAQRHHSSTCWLHKGYGAKWRVGRMQRNQGSEQAGQVTEGWADPGGLPGGGGRTELVK